jgi:palmitoyltransferase
MEDDCPTQFRRRTGLTCPLDCRQVFTWILIALSFVDFVTVNWAFLPSANSRFWGALYLTSYSAGVLLFTIATLTNHQLPSGYSLDHVRVCKHCHEVTPILSKHCKECNRCRLGFDHHCRYINNCVTASNYSVFFYGCLFLLCAWFFAIAHLIHSAVTFVRSKETVLAQVTARLKLPTSELAFWVLLGFGVIINLGSAIPMTGLVLYHSYFQRMKISTYQYIKNRRLKSEQNVCCGCSRNVRVGP